MYRIDIYLVTAVFYFQVYFCCYRNKISPVTIFKAEQGQYETKKKQKRIEKPPNLIKKCRYIFKQCYFFLNLNGIKEFYLLRGKLLCICLYLLFKSFY